MNDAITHAARNQAERLVNANLFAGKLASRTALCLNRPGLDAAFFASLGALAGPAALQDHVARARGAHPALDQALARVLAGLDGDAAHDADEVQAPRLARDTALVLQAALARRHATDATDATGATDATDATDAVFAPLCASRMQERCGVVGASPASWHAPSCMKKV